MKRIIILFVIFLSVLNFGFAQDLKKTEKKVKKLFNKAHYEESLPLLYVLMKTKDNDTYINYMYGVCSIETGNETPNKALQSLILAKNRNLDEPDLDYYIGRAYQDLFEPAKAISFFNNSLKNETVDPEILSLTKSHIIECEEAVKLPADIVKKIIWEKEASYQVFYKLYDFDKSKYGTILLTPEKLAHGNSEVDLAYIPVSKDYIYYSSYDKSTHSKDMYRAAISSQGEYGDPEKLNSYINGLGDEEFPILSSDKSSLYFTSTGFKSTGKQDIFRSVKSMSGDWSKPTKLGLKVNSSFNDFLFFFIPEENIAYFTSNRYHANGKISVYKVELKSAVSKSLETTFFNPNNSNNSSFPDSLVTKEEIPVKKDAITVAKLNMKQKKFANLLVDSSFIYAAKMEKKRDLLKGQKDRCVNVAYNKNIQSKAFYKQYIELASQAANGTNVVKLTSLRTYLGARLKEASVAQGVKNMASHLAKRINTNELAYTYLVDTLKSWAGHLQLLAASNDSKKVVEEYKLFVDLMKKSDTTRDFSDEIYRIEKEDFQLEDEDLLDMDTYLDKKLEILNKSTDNTIVGEKNYLQHQTDSKELIDMALVSYNKLLNSSTNYQKKYLAKDVKSFSRKAQMEQDKLLALLNNTNEEGEYAVNTKEEIDETYENTNEYNNQQEVVEDIVAKEKKEKNSTKRVIEFSNLDNTGLRFRVQLGAFSEKTDLKKFAKVPELSKELIPNKQMFRVLSGNFTSYEKATKAKENLSYDFPGAFIVAYQEGEKISVKQAIQNQSKASLENTGIVKNVEVAPTDNKKGKNSNDSIDKKADLIVKNAEQEKNAYSSEVEKFQKEEKTKDIKENKGELFYIQLGTFSQPKVSNQLYGIEPLLYELMPNGLFRYFTGPYSSSEMAEKRVQTIRLKGAKGAFVVAYKNGEKLKYDSPNTNLSLEKKTSAPQKGLIYKIQLGAFSKKKTPLWVKDMEQRTGANVEVFTANGVFIYTTASFVSLEQAKGFKQGLINKGFNGVFVVAFKDGQKVAIH